MKIPSSISDIVCIGTYSVLQHRLTNEARVVLSTRINYIQYVYLMFVERPLNLILPWLNEGRSSSVVS